MFTIQLIAYLSLAVLVTAYIADMIDEAKEKRV